MCVVGPHTILLVCKILHIVVVVVYVATREIEQVLWRTEMGEASKAVCGSPFLRQPGSFSLCVQIRDRRILYPGPCCEVCGFLP
jgi:hypothetical protein